MQSVLKGRVGLDNGMCCHTETDVADPTCYPTRVRHIERGQTTPSTDPITSGNVTSSSPAFLSYIPGVKHFE